MLASMHPVTVRTCPPCTTLRVTHRPGTPHLSVRNSLPPLISWLGSPNLSYIMGWVRVWSASSAGVDGWMVEGWME